MVIHEDLMKYTHQILSKPLDRMMATQKQISSYTLQKYTQFQHNIALFSAYKSYTQTRDLHLLTSKPEEIQPSLAAKLNAQYNIRWMATEFVHTIRSVRSVINWEYYEQNSHVYPYLEYMPSTAAEPRQSHKIYYGIIKPINDPFWKIHYPPNDWGCKCSTQPVISDANAREVPQNFPLPPPLFRNNPALSGQIIPENHPRIKKIRDKEPSLNLPKAINHKIRTELENYKHQCPYPEKPHYTAKNGSTVTIHPFADPKDLIKNYEVCRRLADTYPNLSIKIRPHIELNGFKNPELEIDNIISDIYEITTKEIIKGIINGFHHKLKKGQQLRRKDKVNILMLINNKFPDNHLANEIHALLLQKIQHYKEYLNAVYLIFNDEIHIIETKTIK